MKVKPTIVKTIENGEKYTSMYQPGDIIHRNESSIRRIKLNAEKSNNSVDCSVPLTSKTTKKFKNSEIDRED